VRLAVGAGFSCTVSDDGSVWCWGELPAEVRGLAPAERLRAPHAIVGLERVHELAADDETLCARTAERRVLCWGEDVRGDTRVPGPAELGPLRGATSIAAAGGRVCAIVGDRLRCVGPNAPAVHDLLGEGAWLAAVGHAICVLDGRGAARCLDADGHALWPVEGSDGAVSLALARGVCAATADGALRCDDHAGRATEASLRPVEGIADARFVAGAGSWRCVGRAERVECEGDDESGRPLRARVVEGSPSALAMAAGPPSDPRASAPWHACARSGAEVRCWGVDIAGETNGRGRVPVERVAEVPGARDLVIAGSSLLVVTASGQLEERDLFRPGAPIVRDLPPLLDLARCGTPHRGPTFCARAEGDRLVRFGPGWEVSITEGFAARAEPFPTDSPVCAPGDGQTAVCATSGPDAVVEELAQPVPWQRRLCGLRRGRVTCMFPDEQGRPTVFSTARVERLFGGADQLFARLEGGVWVALGHNGVGQLGLEPSPPVLEPAVTAANPFTSMAFAYHLSCGWAEQGPLACAGLDEELRPRDVDVFGPSHGYRGDGLWRVVPEVRDVRALDSDGRITCALGASGAIWCWGGEGGGTGPREVGPAEIALAP
jgi:hypothetical protein